MPYDTDIDLSEPSPAPEADDLDALASGMAPVDSWDETGAQDADLDLVALTSSSSSAPPRDESEAEDARIDLASPAREAQHRGSARSEGPARLLGLVVGLGVGFGLASLVFGATAEIASASRPSVPLETPRRAVSSPQPAPPPPSAAAPVLQAAVSASVSATPEPAPAALPRTTTAALSSLPPHEVSPSSRPRPAARQATLARAPAAPQAPESVAVAPHPDPKPAVVAPPAEPAAVEPRPDPAPALAALPVVSPERGADTLLDEALSPAAQREPASPDVLPLMPSRAQVEEALEALRPAIRGCAMGQPGVATADIVVRSDGTVAGVQVTGAPFAGTASGRCMQGVVRPVHFPRFTKPTFHVRFPFTIP